MAEDPRKERTFIMAKPDGVQRGLIHEIIKRFEQKGFQMVGAKFMRPSREHLEAHYADLAERPFFPKLITYMCSGPVFAMAWQGRDVVKSGRVILGETKPSDSKPGSLRGDFCIDVGANIVHGSDSVESANHELGMWFQEGELHDWTSCAETWIYE